MANWKATPFRRKGIQILFSCFNCKLHLALRASACELYRQSEANKGINQEKTWLDRSVIFLTLGLTGSGRISSHESHEWPPSGISCRRHSGEAAEERRSLALSVWSTATWNPQVLSVTLSAEPGAADAVKNVGSSTFPSDPDPDVQRPRCRVIS